MKKTIALLFLAALLLAACGGKPAGGAKQISMMMFGDPAELDIWNKIVADFEAANPGSKVSVDVSDWDSYWTKLKTLLSANTPPDVFAMDAPYYLDYQSKGVLLNLQPYLDKSPAVLNGVYPGTLKAYQTPQGYFGLPRDFQTIVMFYNKDMFDAAGLAYPAQGWTYDDFRSIAKQLTIDKNGDGVLDQFGFSADLYDMELFWSSAIWAYGGDIFNADYTKSLVGSEQARQAWQLAVDMQYMDKSLPDFATSEQYGGDLFMAGKAAMTSIGHWAVPGYAEAMLNFDVAPMPIGPGGQATSVNSAGFVVANATKNPDLAWKFLEYVISSPAQTRLAQLGFACPVLQSVAESPAFLDQSIKINQQVFLDSLAFAHMKPVFKGYDEWSSTIGDGMAGIWAGETSDLNGILDTIVPEADAVLAKNK